jgi:hypothetical protein
MSEVRKYTHPHPFNGVVYMTINCLNGKKYIGRDSYNNKYYIGGGYYFRRAIKKYGRENFIKIILRRCKDKKELANAEQYFLDLYNVAKNNRTYNKTQKSTGGEGHDKIEVHQYDTSGNYIQSFSCIKDAAILYGMKSTCITDAIKRNGFCREFYWSYTRQDKIKVPVMRFKTQYKGQFRKVYMYGDDGVLLREFYNASSAAKELGINKISIYHALQHTQNVIRANGCFWLYDKFDKIPDHILINLQSHRSPTKKIVYQYDFNKNYINSFKSACHASKATGIERSNISMACRGKHKYAGNYFWSFEKRLTY